MSIKNVGFAQRPHRCDGDPADTHSLYFHLIIFCRSMSSKRRFSDNALNSVTATLVAVVLTFLILVSPWELLKFGLQYSSSPMDRYKMDIALHLTNLMQVLNFSFNFVLYCVVNKSFRNTLWKLVCLRPVGKGVR